MLRYFLMAGFMCCACTKAIAQFSPTPCPSRILAVEPKAKCMARTKFNFLVFGSVSVETPAAGCKLVEKHIMNSSNVPIVCTFQLFNRSCNCPEENAPASIWPIIENGDSMIPACPVGYEPLPEKVVVTGAGGVQAAMVICKPKTCPVPPLNPITDPEATEHESGRYKGAPDLEKVTAGTLTGANCMVKANEGAAITSGFRPQSYQNHLREVWDKWKLLQKDTSDACKATKKEIEKHWKAHRMIEQPGQTSEHSAGNAVDIKKVPAKNAKATAKACDMFRPLPNDPVHYQPVEKK